MVKDRYSFKAQMWLYPGPAAWHFITLPKDVSGRIKKTFAEMAKSWGSLPVKAIIGKTSWETSIFPDTKADAYLLPVKAAVRKKEGIAAGDTVNIAVSVRIGDMYQKERL
jgi:hypothetical protein